MGGCRKKHLRNTYSVTVLPMQSFSYINLTVKIKRISSERWMGAISTGDFIEFVSEICLPFSFVIHGSYPLFTSFISIRFFFVTAHTHIPIILYMQMHWNIYFFKRITKWFKKSKEFKLPVWGRWYLGPLRDVFVYTYYTDHI